MPTFPLPYSFLAFCLLVFTNSMLFFTNLPLIYQDVAVIQILHSAVALRVEILLPRPIKLQGHGNLKPRQTNGREAGSGEWKNDAADRNTMQTPTFTDTRSELICYTSVPTQCIYSGLEFNSLSDKGDIMKLRKVHISVSNRLSLLLNG